MGYESRLYVIRKGSGALEDEDGKAWAEVIATFNLCTVNIDFFKYPATDSYIYDGGERVVEDKYGDPLRELTIKEAIDEIELASIDEPYRRWNPVLGLLKGFNEHEWRDLRVLHYGY